MIQDGTIVDFEIRLAHGVSLFHLMVIASRPKGGTAISKQSRDCFAPACLAAPPSPAAGAAEGRQAHAAGLAMSRYHFV